jgi:hypothetical protein
MTCIKKCVDKYLKFIKRIYTDFSVLIKTNLSIIFNEAIIYVTF